MTYPNASEPQKLYVELMDKQMMLFKNRGDKEYIHKIDLNDSFVVSATKDNSLTLLESGGTEIVLTFANESIIADWKTRLEHATATKGTRTVGMDIEVAKVSAQPMSSNSQASLPIDPLNVLPPTNASASVQSHTKEIATLKEPSQTEPQEIKTRSSPPRSLQFESDDLSSRVTAMLSEPLKVYAWDFAGQEKYYSSHRHFLSRIDTIYVLVWDMTQSVKNGVSVKFWLQTLKTYGCIPRNNETDRTRLLILGSHTDKLSESELKSRRSELEIVLSQIDKDRKFDFGPQLLFEVNSTPVHDYEGVKSFSPNFSNIATSWLEKAKLDSNGTTLLKRP